MQSANVIDMNKLKEKIAAMPDVPGVYLMKDSAGKIIYIGKAKSLKKRLTSYIARDLSSKTVALMSHVLYRNPVMPDRKPRIVT